MINNRYDSHLVTASAQEAEKTWNQFLIQVEKARIQVPNSC